MSDYTTPQAFNDLFFDFTGHAHGNYPRNQRSIAQDLARTLSNISPSDEAGPLIVANSVGLYVYSSEPGHPLISSAEYRAAPNSGFYEVTSVSHVGPAIAYLGALQSYGDNAWEDHIEPLIVHLRKVREANAAPLNEHWLSKLDCVSWRGHEQQIKLMIDYACALAGHYLIDIQKNKNKFCSEHLIKYFLESSSQDFPIPYNTVMIGTFALAGLKSAHDVYCALNTNDIHWENAKILLHNLAGTNYSAGLTQGSNWLYTLIASIAPETFNQERILLAPYASLPNDLGKEVLTEDEFKQLTQNIWGSMYSRPIVCEAAFGHIENIVIPYRKPIPGDYEITNASQIDHFMQRLKFSTGNTKEMLSNTVGFWLAEEAAAKNWQLDAIDIPGLTHGLPAGMTGYPDHSPTF